MRAQQTTSAAVKSAEKLVDLWVGYCLISRLRGRNLQEQIPPNLTSQRYVWHASRIQKERCNVSNTVEELIEQALILAPEDRAKLVERLLAGFEPQSIIQSAWLKLAGTRRDSVQAGNSRMVPGDEALARVRARLA